MTRRTILVVDDEPAHLRLMSRILGREYGLLLAGNGPEALAIAVASHRIDLILLDVGLCGMSGYELYAALKADTRTRDVPVVFLSGRWDAESETKARVMGAVDYITKPFVIASLQARIWSLVHKKALAEVGQPNAA